MLGKVWVLLWCADSCLRGGVYTEGARDWGRQGFCVAGQCDTGPVCDLARRDLLEKAQHAHRWAAAHCDAEQ
jgi:hypothetical protein